MAGKQQGIRWDEWIIPAVEAFGKKNGLDDFSKSIKFLVRTALNHYGYYEDTFKPGIKDVWQEPKKPLENKNLKISETEKSNADGKEALSLIDRMKLLMKNKSWGSEILVEFGRQEGPRLFIGDGTGLLKAITAATEAEGYDPDIVLLRSLDKKTS